MFEELNEVTLGHDIKEYNLKEGDRGTIVHVYGKGEGYEVEFFDTKGNTIAVLTLASNDIRLISSEGEHFLHGFSPPIYVSNASSITSIMGVENVLGGFGAIFDSDKMSVKEESKSKVNIEEFHFSTATS